VRAPFAPGCLQEGVLPRVEQIFVVTDFGLNIQYSVGSQMAARMDLWRTR
jgi:hypothetical protein